MGDSVMVQVLPEMEGRVEFRAGARVVAAARMSRRGLVDLVAGVK